VHLLLSGPCRAAYQLLIGQRARSAAAFGEFCKQATTHDRRQQQSHGEEIRPRDCGMRLFGCGASCVLSLHSIGETD